MRASGVLQKCLCRSLLGVHALRKRTLLRAVGITVSAVTGSGSLPAYVPRWLQEVNLTPFFGAAANSPWISTTRSLEVAQGYEGGNGIVAIDLSKVDAPYVELWQQAPPTLVGGPQSIPYWRSLYAQEVTVNQAIPRNAIIGWVKTP